MKRFKLGIAAFLVLTIASRGAAEPLKVTAESVLAEFDRMAGLPLWPGFEPKRIPVALYDGTRTILVRHPAPPSGFTRQGDVWLFPGQHPAMRANTAVDLGGTTTATLLLDLAHPREVREWAAVLLGHSDTLLEVLDGQALTEGAGAHPLFNGIRRLTVTGLPSEPAVRQEGGTTTIEVPGFTAKLQGATVERGDKVLKVRWGS